MPRLRRLLPLFLVLLLAVQVSGCAKQSPAYEPMVMGATSEDGGNQTGTGDEALDDLLDEYASLDAEPLVDDPLEGWNRFWFEVNDVVYSFVLSPIVDVYNFVVPEPVRKGVKNFFHNLAFPVRFVNCLLQGEFLSAGVEFSRFIGNTVFGGLGFSDAFNHMRCVVETDDEDFGQTLGAWGFGHGCYLVWPLIGPSSLRDSVGMVGDMLLNPTGYITPWYLSYGLTAYKTFNDLSFRLGDYFEMKESAIDPYTAFRNLYIQLRNAETER